MAEIRCTNDVCEVQLPFLERLGALRGNFTLPVQAIRDVRIVDEPFAALRGVRWPGTGMPGVVALGTWRFGGVRDFVAVFGRQRAVEITLADQPFDRLLIGSANPEAVADHLERARSRA